MKKQITLLTAAIAVTCGSYSSTALSARPNTPIPLNAVLQITAGVPTLDSSGNQNGAGSLNRHSAAAFFSLEIGNTPFGEYHPLILCPRKP